MLCISTSFQVLHALKSWLKYFSCPFSTFCVDFQMFFSDFSSQNKKKHLENCISRCSLKLFDTQMLDDSLRGTSKFSFRGSFSISASFQVHAPEC